MLFAIVFAAAFLLAWVADELVIGFGAAFSPNGGANLTWRDHAFAFALAVVVAIIVLGIFAPIAQLFGWH